MAKKIVFDGFEARFKSLRMTSICGICSVCLARLSVKTLWVSSEMLTKQLESGLARGFGGFGGKPLGRSKNSEQIFRVGRLRFHTTLLRKLYRFLSAMGVDLKCRPHSISDIVDELLYFVIRVTRSPLQRWSSLLKNEQPTRPQHEPPPKTLKKPTNPP